MAVTHLVFRAAGPAPIAPTRADVRRVVSALLRVGWDVPLLAFQVSDGHVHLLVALGRVEAGRLAQRVTLALRPAVSGGVRCVGYTEVRDPGHLTSTFEYVLRNDEKHGVAPDPWRENGALPDLLGLRAVRSTLLTTVRRCLPRVNGAVLRRMAGWPDLVPAGGTVGVEAALAAVTAALAVDPLSGRGDAAVDGRRALAHLFPAAPAALAAALGRTVESLWVLRAVPPREDLLRATRMQLSLQGGFPLVAPGPFATGDAPVPWADAPRFLSARTTEG